MRNHAEFLKLLKKRGLHKKKEISIPQNINNEVTYKTNNFFHDPINGLHIGQNKYIDECFLKLKNDYGQPKNIIEIGTCWGGSALFFAKMFPKSKVYTFDIVDWGNADHIIKRDVLFKKYGITYIKEGYADKNSLKIKTLLKDKSILLCDGGHKENEFSGLMGSIKKHSIIMAHDYGRNLRYFRNEIQGKYWNESFEFDGSKFDAMCARINLLPYMQDDFEKAVWYIRKKI